MAPFVPLDEQTAAVVVEKLTVSPDDAVALTVSGVWASVLVGQRGERDRLSGESDLEALRYR